ncbi:hypothetical protein ACFVSN_26660 [Kitasatospora sp. NPDC057904]|uniref:hypothetical protein n=1 Tax=unclassified Kitasatospora TaxID=2633591 RepID=UPI0036DBFE7C
MTDHGDTTRIHNAQGQTHTGSGTQNNYNYYFVADRLIREGGDPLRMAVERRLWLSRRFIPPPGYGEAAKRLEGAGTAVLVSGNPGNGRRTAAVVLLHRAGGKDDPFREVALDDRRDEPAALSAGERVLIDLSGMSEQELGDAHNLVRSYWAMIERCGGRLAVAAARDHEHRVQSDLRQLLVPIGRPDGSAVLARHLHFEHIEMPSLELQSSSLGEVLASSPMRELNRLSELMVEARSQGGEPGSWAVQAIAALRMRREEAERHIASLTEGRQRALLFTAAMLDGAPADAVFRLSDRLLRTLRHPEDERPRLDRADLTARLPELQVQVTKGRVGFGSLAYGAAVRSHFWFYYPDLREPIGSWVSSAVRRTPYLEETERRKLVSRFTEQALASRDIQLLTELVEAWAKGTGSLPSAMAVLEQGLEDERSGAAFRKKIYDWSVDTRSRPLLVRGLARICVDVMAPHHPNQALVRLHQLARREGAPHDARAALFELLCRQEWLHEELLIRSCDGMERSSPYRADVGIFLGLVDPLPSKARYDLLVRGWRGVLDLAPPDVWSPKVRTWLSAARRKPGGGGRLMRILIDAADGRIDVLSRYYMLTYDWSAEPDDDSLPLGRADVAARFRRDIDLAQGIEPLDLTAAGVRGGRGM